MLRTTERCSSSHPCQKNTRYPKRGQGWSATDFAVGVRNSDELLGCELPSGVPRLTPAKKILAIQNVGRGGVREASLSATVYKRNCSKKQKTFSFLISLPLAANHRAVFLISAPAHKKYSLSKKDNEYFWWAGVDSDHRSQVTTDLQSVPFGRSGTYPYMWSWRLESNPQPADYKSAALPIELHQQIC